MYSASKFVSRAPGRRLSHWVSHFDRKLTAAIRKGEALKCDVDLGYYGVVAANVGNESFKRRAYMAWDSGSQKLKKA